MHKKEHIVYCNSRHFRYGDLDPCEQCPKGAVCYDGEIIDCENKYLFVNEEKCIPKSYFNDLVLEMVEFTLNLVATVNGQNLCLNQSEFDKTINSLSKISGEN